MRMSRWTWLGQFFRPTIPTGPRERTGPQPQPKAKLRVWLIAGQRFEARTRSEARAQAKVFMRRMTGRKGRLPVGVEIREIRA